MTGHPEDSPRVRRTSTTLAAGRELIYFDDSEPYLSGATRREAVDERPLDERRTAGTMCLDALTGDWVSIADHRQNRTFLPPTDECPLCPSGGGTIPSEIPAHEYDVVVFENRFPAFASGPTAAGSSAAGSSAGGSTAAGPSGNPLLASAPAVGRCEVICFTSDHGASFSSLSPERARTVVDVWADRTRELSALEAVEHVFPFENRGQEIGVTLHHPHGQIYAYPFVPVRTASLLRAATEHHQRTGRRPHQNLARNEGIVQSLEVPDAGVRVAGVVLGFSACGLEHGVGSWPLVAIFGWPRRPEWHYCTWTPATTSSNPTDCMPPSATRRCPPSTAAGMPSTGWQSRWPSG